MNSLETIHSEVPDSSLKNRVIINVSGHRFETYEKTLAVYPDTLLGSPERRWKYFNSLTGEFSFARDARCFDSILFYYQSNGILARPCNVDRKVFDEEVRFFEVTEIDVEEDNNSTKTSTQTIPEIESFGKIRRYLWEVLENPFAGRWTSCIGVLNIILVIAIVALNSVATLSEFSNPTQHASIDVKTGVITRYSGIFYAVEVTCIAWFTLDYILRLASASKSFAFSTLGLIEFTTIISFYITISLNQFIDQLNFLGHTSKYLRYIRVLHIFRLVRYNNALKGLIEALPKGIWHTHQIIVAAFVMVTSFASLLFHAEVTSNSSKNLVDWAWFVVITMTTVGYGDIYPQTILGKCLGVFCAIFGVLLFCFLTPLILRYFFKLYYLPMYLSKKCPRQKSLLIQRFEKFYFQD